MLLLSYLPSNRCRYILFQLVDDKKTGDDSCHGDDYLDDDYQQPRWTRSSRRREREEKREVSPPRQCLGPGCVHAARTNSKYCCNECGVRLQIRRLQVILPTRSAMKNDTYHANQVMENKIKALRVTQKVMLCEVDEMLDLFLILLMLEIFSPQNEIT